MNSTQINEDWEMESQKDFIYLLEEQRLLEEQIMKEMYEQEAKRKPAQIAIIQEKTQSKDNEKEDKSEVLPF